MKKTLLTIFLAAMSVAALAQTTTFGIKGGLNFSKFAYNLGSLQDASYSSDFLTGFQAGVFADFKVSKSGSIQPALLYAVKGANINSGGLTGNGFSDVDTKRTVNYLHLPVNILFHKPLGKNEIYFGGGPFISYALSGRSKGTTTLVEDNATKRTTISFDEKVNFSNTYNGMKRIDAGIELLAGFKFSNGFLVNLNYDHGLANIEKGMPNIKTRGFAISVGCAF